MPNDELIEAAKAGNFEQVQLLLNNGADVNHANQNGNTALIWVTYYGHQDIVQQLIAARADVNLVNKKSTTPLMWAADNAHKGVIRSVLGDGLFDLYSTEEKFQQSLDRINQITRALDDDKFKKDRKIIREYFPKFLKESIEQILLTEHGEQILNKLTLLKDELSIIQQNEDEKKSGKQKTAMKELLAVIDSVKYKIIFNQETGWKELIEAVKGISSSSNLNDPAINEKINILLNAEMLPNGKAQTELLNYLKKINTTDFESLKTKLKHIALATGGVGVRQDVQQILGTIFSANKPSYDQNPFLFILRTGQGKFEQKDTTSFKALRDKFNPSKPGLFNRRFKSDSGTSSNKNEPLPGLRNNRGEEDL